MSYIIDLPTFSDDRGSLTVIENALPYAPKRIYFIYDASEKRGGHRHKKTIQALVCIGGSCEIYINDGQKEETILLDNAGKCLILEPKDWHTMDNFSAGSVLLVLSSELYEQEDYIDEAYA